MLQVRNGARFPRVNPLRGRVDEPMKICLVGLDNLPVLVPEYREHTIGGEPVQHTLLGRALVRRGHDVSMVVGDYGQTDGARWQAIRVFKAYRRNAGLPVLRFIHPRWTRLWSALKRADADLYYSSCAGMQVGLVALFCRCYRRRFVFRTTSDTDCDRSRLLVQPALDRWLYEQGLRRADAILVQSVSQAKTLAQSYGLSSRVAGMLVEHPLSTATRDIDVLWVSNIRRLKRPDRLLELAERLPGVQIHMVGGSLPDEESLYRHVKRAAAARSNVVFHDRLSYWDTNALYGRARVLVNTSDVDGFPNSYLQAWIRGVPVVTLTDPDGVIERERLGMVASFPDEIPGVIMTLLDDSAAWQAASARCLSFMEREYGDDRILGAYLETFEELTRADTADDGVILSGRARHV
jgi:glycosyltransferase involved in cell wall biosynthesis